MRTPPRFYLKKEKIEVPKSYTVWKCEDVIIQWEQSYLEEGAEESGFLFWKRVRYWYRTVWCYFEGIYNTCNPNEVRNIHERLPRQPMEKIYSSPKYMWRWDDPGTASNPKGASSEFSITIGLRIYLDTPKVEDGGPITPPEIVEDDLVNDNSFEGETKSIARTKVSEDLKNGDHYENRTEVGSEEITTIDPKVLDQATNEFSFLAAGAIAQDRSGMWIRTAGHKTFWCDAMIPISADTLRGLGVFDGRTLDKFGKPVEYVKGMTYTISGMDMTNHSPGSTWAMDGNGISVWVPFRDLRITLRENGITDTMVAQ